MRMKFRIMFFSIFIMVLFSLTTLLAEGKTFKYVSRPANIKNKVQNSRGVSLKQTMDKPSFKIYKVLITTNKLNIRKTPSTTGTVLGTYDLGNIVDVISKSGTFLKTDNGYIAEGYTKKIIGMFISVTTDSAIIRNSDMKIDKRVAMTKKYYKIIDSKDNKLLIKVGRVNGYIPQNSIRSISDTQDNKVSIGWEYLNKKSGNAKIYNDKSSFVNMKSNNLGLDVLSPTWFDVTGAVSDISSIKINDMADINYVNIAHKNGYEVWARFCEMDKSRAAIEFSNKTVRARIISQISKYAITYDLDGINVDYEALGSANKDGFTSFMKELYSNLKKLNLNVSVDITKYSKASSLYSLCYDRPNLAKYSDYLILMGYDEHVSSSKDPGSVGSYNWVDTAIKDIINQGVPSKKLILAVPFYLRDFTVISYNAVMFNKNGKIYNAPLLSESNKLLDSKKGNFFKCLGSEGNWYIIDYNGNKGYITKNNAQFMAATVNQSTSGSAITSGGSVTLTSGSSIIITTGSGINSIPDGAINISIPYDIAIIKKDCVIYKSENESTTNIMGDGAANKYFKYLRTLGDWYAVDFNGKTGYVSKSQASYIKSESRALSSNSMSMNDALNRITQYGGSTFYDDVAKQTVGIYFKDDAEHEVWLETNESMQWRMDLVNNYDLAGAAAWSLYWKPTNGIWDVIKSSLKSSSN